MQKVDASEVMAVTVQLDCWTAWNSRGTSKRRWGMATRHWPADLAKFRHEYLRVACNRLTAHELMTR